MRILRVRLEVAKKIKKKKTQHIYYDDRILNVFGEGYSTVPKSSPSLN